VTPPDATVPDVTTADVTIPDVTDHDRTGPDVMIRPPRPDELPRLQEIEILAGKLFLEVGMPEVAGDEPDSLEALEAFRRDGRAWVLVDGADRPVGYALALVVDGGGHLQQVSVVPATGRQGLGRRLVERVCHWAKDEGYPWVTLSTFKDVPWNGPFYARCGFVPVPEAELGPGLRRLREAERQAGLDVERRHFMRRAS
jgi:GNAT superfamily N-acetyltransferase